MRQKQDPNIKAFWQTCRDWVGFEGACDQWWLFTAECPHGKFVGESMGPLDLSEAIRDSLEGAQNTHEEL